ncbi:protein phosphatase 1 regulatory subunit 12A isoform X3 [Bradysia coprophila]|uniref:protein phosphatase 1 regulatory subunit 12A isoform X3 n=1 Tax=Bradysia coprophila TaxID=38358 RepID=UPI00187DB4F3|nr:protein phosphatase 1 regulatory subunit 12A isoform X3 [Bradysia coprophila]
MSFDTRNNSAMYKRAEQLKRWEESDTNREPPEPKNLSSRKIKFSSGCVFLAACMSADRAEVLRLLDNGADIDTVNVDGLTALHQACIDDNLEMVEFLVQQGADVNRQDNEGWTPLHATSSCGFLSIANYLIENGADLAAVSGDGELAIDVAESNRMEELLQKYINEKGIDCDEARQSEERQMLTDAKNWLRGDASKADEPHPRTGATALHVAAAKGYSKVLSLLLATRADVDKQDNDGWTPLHAAAHWGQKEAAQMLVAALADMDVKNYAGQTPIDVADPSMIRFLEDLKKNNKRSKRRPISQIRISDNMDNHIETPSKVIRVDGNEIIVYKNAFLTFQLLRKGEKIRFLEQISESDNFSGDESDDTESTESSHSTSISDSCVEDKPKPPTEPAALVPKDSNSVAEDDAPWRRSGSLRTRAQQESPPKTNVPERESVPADSDVILRRTQSFEEDEKFYKKYIELRARIKANSCPVLPASPVSGVGIGVNNSANNYSVQRSSSLKDHRQLRKTVLTPIVSSPSTTTPPVVTQPGQVRRPAVEELVKSKFNSVNNLAITAPTQKMPANRPVIGGSALALDKINEQPPMPRNASSVVDLVNATAAKNGDKELTQTSANNNKRLADELKQINNTNTEPATIRSKFTPGNIFKNFFKSFVPPVRDEESETQRKAHAKRVRETRRSTQGVTLDEIKSAEELVKKKNMNNNNNDSETPTSTAINDRVPTIQTTEGNISQQSSTDVQSTSPTDHVTATYTINAPTSSARVDDKVTATYTINPPPTSTSPSSNTVSFSAIVPIAKSVNESKDTELVESTISATINVPPPSNAKTDLEMLTKTASPTIAQTNFKFDSSRSSDTTEESTKPVENDVKLEFPFTKSHRDKRSLFDMDNAASLSLAEKLRNEANKYSNNDVSSIVGNKHLSGKAEDNERKSDSTPSSPAHHGMAAERRPSWRLKFDAGSKFKLEDVPASNITSTSNNIISSNNTTPVGSTISQRRQINSNSNPSPPTERPVSAPVISTANSELSNDRTKENTSEVTLSLRRPKSSSEDKENDKENDSRTAQATQAVIQRRRRPKRRSTGVVHVDMDDIDPERQDGDIDDKESGSESRTSRSRLGSTSSLASEQNDAKSDSAAENGDIDYKALYEASRLENEKLKTQLKKKEDDLSTAKATVDRFTNATTKNSLSELEKRERRAMERKLSEMEEELKQYEALKTENQRLKDENGALIRVISKLR